MLSERDAYFASFPETAAPQVSSLLVFPLREEEKLAGVLTVSRKESPAFAAHEIEMLGKLAGAVLVAVKEIEGRREVESLRERLRSARRQNTVLEKRLADRKNVERAKGLLQIQYGWTEEDAYYYIRRTAVSSARRWSRLPSGFWTLQRRKRGSANGCRLEEALDPARAGRCLVE